MNILAKLLLPLQCSLGNHVASLLQKLPARPGSRGGRLDPITHSRNILSHYKQNLWIGIILEPSSAPATVALGLCLTHAQLFSASRSWHQGLFPWLVTYYPLDFSLNATP